jgi:hypothetical protein
MFGNSKDSLSYRLLLWLDCELVYHYFLVVLTTSHLHIFTLSLSFMLSVLLLFVTLFQDLVTPALLYLPLLPSIVPSLLL